MKQNTIAKKRAALLLTLLVITLLLTCILSTASAYAAEYEKIADLNGKKIGVQTGCLYETHIADKCPDAEIQYFTMPQDMIRGGRLLRYCGGTSRACGAEGKRRHLRSSRDYRKQ